MSKIWKNSDYDPFRLKDIREEEIKKIEKS